MSTLVIVAGIAIIALSVILVASHRNDSRRSSNDGATGSDTFDGGSSGNDCTDSGSDGGGCDGGDVGGGGD